MCYSRSEILRLQLAYSEQHHLASSLRDQLSEMTARLESAVQSELQVQELRDQLESLKAQSQSTDIQEPSASPGDTDSSPAGPDGVVLRVTEALAGKDAARAEPGVVPRSEDAVSETRDAGDLAGRDAELEERVRELTRELAAARRELGDRDRGALGVHTTTRASRDAERLAELQARMEELQKNSHREVSKLKSKVLKLQFLQAPILVPNPSSCLFL